MYVKANKGWFARGAMAIMLVLALPVWGLPLWNIRGGGSSGSLGDDGAYSPFDGRYVLRYGEARFLDMHGNDAILQPGQSQTVVGTLTLSMDLEGKVYNSKAAVNPVADGTSLGQFKLVFTYYNAVLATRHDYKTDTTTVSVTVPASGKMAGFGFGTLAYVNDTLPKLPNGDGSVDGEAQGDVRVIRTPSCGVAGVDCPEFFFSWSGHLSDVNASKTGLGGSPVGKAMDAEPRGFFDLPAGERIPLGVLSLIHGGGSCPKDEPPHPGSKLVACNPVRGNFDSDRAYASFATKRAAAFGFAATMQRPSAETHQVESATAE